MLRYAEALVREGHEVEVLALRREGASAEETLNGVRLTRLQRRRVSERSPVSYLAKLTAFLLRAAAVITSRHRRRPYDLIHVHNVPDFLVFAAWLPKRTETPVILDIHDILPELYVGKFGARCDGWTARALKWIERRSAQFADHVIVANDLWHDKLVARAVPAARCTTLMNYPDTSLFRPAAKPVGRSDRFLVLYPGTLNRHQGLDVAVKAFSQALPEMPGAEFHIYGEGPAAGELRELIARLGVNGSVCLHGLVPLAEIARVMAEADLGVIPKRAQGFGDEAFSTKSLEFMACGVPLVMSRTTIDSRYFSDDLVRFFPSGDVEALARELVAAYRDREGSAARARRAQEFAMQEGWENRRHVYLELVHRLTASKKGPPIH
ncbi:MAG: glycosyltransferase [Acidobacteriota bacterium]